MSATYSPAHYYAAISLALNADDMPGVVALLHGLALVDPRGAALIVDTVKALVELNEEAP